MFKSGVVKEILYSEDSTALLIELADGSQVLKLADDVSRSYAVSPKTLDFKTAPAPTKEKTCKKGYACKGTCIAKGKQCKQKLDGDAAKAADYLDAKVPKAKAAPKANTEAKSAKLKDTPSNVPSANAFTTTAQDRSDYQQQLKANKIGQNLLKEGKRLEKKLKGPPPYAEELAAVQAYSSLYYAGMNKTLRGDIKDMTSDEVRQLQQHTKMATAALDALPSTDAVVYRGSQLPKSVVNQYKVGATVTEKAFTSTSTNIKVAQDFGEATGDRQSVVYTIKSSKGKSIKQISALEKEEEVLFRPDSQFKVLNKKTKNGIVHIFMEEI